MKKIILAVLLFVSATLYFPKTAVSGLVSLISPFVDVVERVVDDVVSNALVNALVDDDDSLVRSVSDYYAVPMESVTYVRVLGVPNDELPVVFYLARESQVAPVTIAELRLQGMSWQDITNRYGHGAEIFYVPVNVKMAIGPPYGHAYGYYRNKPQKDWNTIVLDDGDVINLVNLKFITDHYRLPADKVMKMRHKNKGFYTISDDVAKQTGANKQSPRAVPAKKVKSAPAHPGKSPDADKVRAGDKQEKVKDNPDHLTGTKKQVDKAKKFLKKKNEKAKKFINDKG